ncbi:hypothetical protein M752DRAFT_61026 [Aspergillus phoenicis ATCC 13157]|uniref:Uncharacterized protein n=1 Tax=Aspergillus phoenicis ATCC 13157 TaxID=1353007 RepID=A0A370PAD1_ASPPH|nr:hypothetical protein M752DRAFT_61026 [Aspergillus phoenicis ATCC 13157]
MSLTIPNQSREVFLNASTLPGPVLLASLYGIPMIIIVLGVISGIGHALAAFSTHAMDIVVYAWLWFMMSMLVMFGNFSVLLERFRRLGK